MVKGLHHVALRCSSLDNYTETLDFYKNIIGMTVKYSWGEGVYAATMLELNGSVIVIFASGRASGDIGAINHFCFEVDDPALEVQQMQEAGYPVLVPATHVNLSLTNSSKSELLLTYAYCMGPVGEVIEFYKEHGQDGIK